MSRPPTVTSVTPRLRLFKDVWLLPPSIVVITNTTFCNQNDHSESRPRPTFSTKISSGYSIKICQSFVHWRRFVDCFSKKLQEFISRLIGVWIKLFPYFRQISGQPLQVVRLVSLLHHVKAIYKNHKGGSTHGGSLLKEVRKLLGQVSMGQKYSMYL